MKFDDFTYEHFRRMLDDRQDVELQLPEELSEGFRRVVPDTGQEVEVPPALAAMTGKDIADLAYALSVSGGASAKHAYILLFVYLRGGKTYYRSTGAHGLLMHITWAE